MTRRLTAGSRAAAIVAIVVIAALSLLSLSAANCPNGCSAHGACDYTTDTCTCYDGFSGADCSLRGCRSGKAWFDFATATDTAHANAECSNMGSCDRTTGLCDCHPGFTGEACQLMECEGFCNGHGTCMTLEQAAKYRDDWTLLSSTTYATLWDHDKIAGCICDPGWTGYDCSLRQCLFGDDPLTTTNTNDEIQKIECTCPATCSGDIVVTFRGHTTKDIAHNAVIKTSDETSTVSTVGIGAGESIQSKLEAITSISGVTVSSDGSALCGTSKVTTLITFTHEHGDLPEIKVTNNLATTSGSVTLAVSTTQTGDKEWAECSNRGQCERVSGICDCFEGYSASNGQGASGSIWDCGYVTGSPPVAGCPGDCSDHGTCAGSPTYVCTCHEGWMGGDCNLRRCPSAKAWFDEPTATDTAHGFAECSNAGHCNRNTGVCECRDGFEGSACQRLACPRDDKGQECSGRGRCHSMEEVQQYRTVNGELSGVKEVQTIACTQAAATTFTLTYNHATTADISSTATTTELKAALEALPTIGLVSVSYNTGAAACGVGVTFSVTFDTELGDVPEMTATGSAIAATATEATKGTYVTYGTNHLASTWDHDMIWGCLCDHNGSYNKSLSTSSASTGDILEYRNYMCGERTCPTGNDPRQVDPSTAAVDEVQTVTCTGTTSDTFTLTFRQSTTTSLNGNDNAATIAAALEALPTIGDVTVGLTGDACAASPTAWTVTFHTEQGNLPPMTGTTSGTSIVIGESVAGTKSNAECSNRGMCDRDLGVCKCFTGYASSSSYADGWGARGDCGYATALYIDNQN